MTKHGLTAYERVMLKVERKESGCLEFMGSKNLDGYGNIAAGQAAAGGRLQPGAHRLIPVHRAVFEHHHGPIPAGLQVCHRCDNPPCVEIEHLFAGTAQENAQDMVSKGRAARNRQFGAANHLTKVSDEQVAQMRELKAAGVSTRDIAERYGLSQHHTWRILAGKRRPM